MLTIKDTFNNMTSLRKSVARERSDTTKKKIV